MKGATARIGLERVEALVSIHAPVKGATNGPKLLQRDFIVSIHAPVKGATCSTAVRAMPAKFQSTRP